MSEDTVDNEKITIRSLIKQYFVRWRLLMLAAVLVAIAVLLWAHHVPLQYTGTAIFERRRDPVSVETSSRSSESFESRKETLRYDMASREAVEEAIEVLGLTKNMERDEFGGLTDKGRDTKQLKVEEFSKKIKIKWEVSSDQIDLVSVNFTHSDRKLAEQMPNTLVANYIDRVLKQAKENLTKNKEFLERSTENCNNKLTGLLRKRIEFEEQNKGAIPESSSVLYEKIFMINSDLDSRRLQHQVAQQELAGLQGLSQSLTGSDDPNEPQEIHMIPNPLLARREAELQQAKDELRSLKDVATATEKHPRVEDLRRRIASLEELIKETEAMVESEFVYGRSADNPAFLIQLLRTEATVTGTKADIERLEGQKNKYEEILDDFGSIRQNYVELTNEIETQEAELNRWESSLQAVNIALGAEVAKHGTHLNAVQVALEQYRPSEPNLWNVLGISVLGGLAFGGVMVFLAIRLDQSVITPEQAAKGFGIPVFGFVSVIMTPRKLFVRFIKRWVVLPVVALLLTAVLGLLTFSLTLRLHYPEEYKEWRKDEAAYLQTHASQLWTDVKETIQNP